MIKGDRFQSGLDAPLVDLLKCELVERPRPRKPEKTVPRIRFDWSDN